MVKTSPTNTGDIRDVGSICGSGRSPVGGNIATLSSILAWKIAWTEEPCGRKQLDMTEHTGTRMNKDQ